MDYNNWYVLYVNPIRVHQVIKVIKKYQDQIEVWYFTRIIPFNRRKGIVKKALPLFPGYLFVHKHPQFILDLVKKKYKNDVIKPICFKQIKCSECFVDGSPCMVPPYEMEFILNCMNNSGRIPVSTLYKKGDKIIVTSGPLKNKSGLISEVNKRGRHAIIELYLFGKLNRVKIGIKFVELENDDRTAITKGEYDKLEF